MSFVIIEGELQINFFFFLLRCHFAKAQKLFFNASILSYNNENISVLWSVGFSA